MSGKINSSLLKRSRTRKREKEKENKINRNIVAGGTSRECLLAQKVVSPSGSLVRYLSSIFLSTRSWTPSFRSFLVASLFLRSINFRNVLCYPRVVYTYDTPRILYIQLKFYRLMYSYTHTYLFSNE